MSRNQSIAMTLIEIPEPVLATVAGRPDQTILIPPGTYEGERWVHPGMEQETVKIVRDGQTLSFERESRLARRAISTLGGDPFESLEPVTLAEFLEEARVFFGDYSFDTLTYYARLS
ncbi:hypothetical protein VB737_10245 [Synechococcus sp. BA-120 BA3]|nr:hypothetical protein [Synechococcus sp. BA-120 BA3]